MVRRRVSPGWRRWPHRVTGEVSSQAAEANARFKADHPELAEESAYYSAAIDVCAEGRASVPSGMIVNDEIAYRHIRLGGCLKAKWAEKNAEGGHL
jgi:hypothetical protein